MQRKVGLTAGGVQSQVAMAAIGDGDHTGGPNRCILRAMLAVRSRTYVNVHEATGAFMQSSYAVPSARDRFLDSLASADRPLSVELARNLLGCRNPLPGITCAELGLPVSSTYDCAARRVLKLYAPDNGQES